MTENASNTILLLNGPNLNLLGTREPEIYGHDTLADVEQLARDTAAAYGLEVRAVQSNHEGVLIDAIHEARTTAAGIIMNPGAFTHTSVALADAISGVQLPAIEVHISNVHKREAFRHHSYISPVASSIIIGAGVHGYKLAVQQLAHLLGK
ncbi:MULTISPECIES: type II 3-dehydroquinate dehydratase [Glutamicibacter]|uniref:3-dehydroquinate dehydratase n=1 Tax=Glutamicibacter nicotianae TaxID=37929 RepID=A0ABQ0RPN2_GLUNI|nr:MULTISPECIES: type II 3-dehydroquinate dehydratase [Glutamicibacter]KWR71718.1 3-dehydroquinate dehydratase [Arthrobacter sp. W1]MDV2981405.1 type II 3-dehydroquinate dehydratase [Actinomycetes bacterium ARC8]QEP07951.1 type II 3-dehydroquinate dehydratase [Glutamicibacter sp. ZJUTW]RWZ82457.1 type II 3-dehydroquinate dehydratase [Glutamicibacter sp. HZAU]UTM46493.1 type II 3-dehydroquinate dehydratase [Glutamicibacter mysorens]